MFLKTIIRWIIIGNQLFPWPVFIFLLFLKNLSNFDMINFFIENISFSIITKWYLTIVIIPWRSYLFTHLHLPYTVMRPNAVASSHFNHIIWNVQSSPTGLNMRGCVLALVKAFWNIFNQIYNFLSVEILSLSAYFCVWVCQCV